MSTAACIILGWIALSIPCGLLFCWLIRRGTIGFAPDRGPQRVLPQLGARAMTISHSGDGSSPRSSEYAGRGGAISSSTFSLPIRQDTNPLLAIPLANRAAVNPGGVTTPRATGASLRQQPGTRGAVRSMNLSDVLHRWSFLRTRVQFRQESPRGFTNSFYAPSFAAAHVQHSEPEGIPNDGNSTARHATSTARE